MAQIRKLKTLNSLVQNTGRIKYLSVANEMKARGGHKNKFTLAKLG
jgi:hypothetical protein